MSSCCQLVTGRPQNKTESREWATRLEKSNSPVLSTAVAAEAAAGVAVTGAATGGSGSPVSMSSAGGWSPTGAMAPAGAGATMVATDEDVDTAVTVCPSAYEATILTSAEIRQQRHMN